MPVMRSATATPRTIVRIRVVEGVEGLPEDVGVEVTVLVVTELVEDSV